MTRSSERTESFWNDWPSEATPEAMRVRYLTFDEILAIHDRMIAVFGGEDGILSEVHWKTASHCL